MPKLILKISLIIIILTIILIPLANRCLAADSQSIWQFGGDNQAKINDALKSMQDGTINKEQVNYLILAVIGFLMFAVVSIGTLFLIVNGYQYMAAVGNPDKTQKAKSGIVYAIAGIVIAGLAASITAYVNKSLGGPIAHPAGLGVLMTQITSSALTFFGVVAVLFLIAGGYQYLTAAGNPENIQKAKNTIKNSIIGIVIVILSKTITNIVWNKVQGQPALTEVANRFISTILGVTTIVAVAFLIAGGYQYITSTGNPENIQKAKNTILYSVIGLVIVILSYAILKFICGVFNVICI